MNRRVFNKSILGTVLGIIVGTNSPFRAVQASYRKSLGRVARMAAAVRTFYRPEKELYDYRIVIVTADGEEFWSAEIVKIERSIKDAKIVWISKGVDFTDEQQLAIKTAVLVDDSGQEVTRFDYDIYMCIGKGERLDVTYTITM